MILWHHHPDPSWRIERRVHVQPTSGVRLGKPAGLWLAVPTGQRDSWWDWCGAENETGFLGGWRTPVEADTARLLTIDHPDQLDSYAYHLHGIEHINWAAAARDGHAGILIDPYDSYPCWPRIPPMWWHGWDCASACVWDTTICAAAGPAEEIVPNGTIG